MTRAEIVRRLEDVRTQKQQSEQIQQQVVANINALAGAIQFAEDLLKQMDEDAAKIDGLPADAPG